MNSFKWIDLFRKLPKDLTEPTFCGALGKLKIKLIFSINCVHHHDYILGNQRNKKLHLLRDFLKYFNLDFSLERHLQSKFRHYFP